MILKPKNLEIVFLTLCEVIGISRKFRQWDHAYFYPKLIVVTKLSIEKKMCNAKHNTIININASLIMQNAFETHFLGHILG